MTRRHLIAGAAGAVPLAHAANGQVLFEGFAIEPRARVQEATLSRLEDGWLWLLFGENKRLVGKISRDRGRTWGPVQPLLDKGGAPIETGRDNVHLTMLHLKSGRLGIVYGGPYSRPGRDGTLHFRSSADGGATWSPAVVIDPVFSLYRTSGARALSNGRIAVPTFNWYSQSAGGDSESARNSICISWVVLLRRRRHHVAAQPERAVRQCRCRTRRVLLVRGAEPRRAGRRDPADVRTHGTRPVLSVHLQ